jgi:methyltransferase (TIGR00027 family)
MNLLTLPSVNGSAAVGRPAHSRDRQVTGSGPEDRGRTFDFGESPWHTNEVDMARTDDDSWDLASSVGATATMVAAARAVATKSGDPLINDPFAEPLVRAVGVQFLTRFAGGELDRTDDGSGLQPMVDWMAVRTRYFDEYVTEATRAGIRQVVILASGLDSRAYRMAWPAGTTVFELDQPQVIEFKTKTLNELGAQPTVHRKTVSIDLRQDWPAALRQAGFQSDQPTAWLAEGLLRYLPPDAQDRLLDDITAQSSADSRLGTNIPGIHQLDDTRSRARPQAFAARARTHGLDLDVDDLSYLGARNDVATYLEERGWQTFAATTVELLAAYGVATLDDDEDAPFAGNVHLTAIRK